MEQINESIKDTFSPIAGVLFRVNGAFYAGNIPLENDQQNLVVLLWTLFTESVSRAETSEDVFAWINQQLEYLGYLLPGFTSNIKRDISSQWAAWLPLLMFSKESEKKDLWNCFCNIWSESTLEEKLLRNLMFDVIETYGKTFYTSMEWQKEVKNPDKFDTPIQQAVIKLGLTIKNLSNSVEVDEEKALLESWRKVLLDSVLHKLPEKVNRGFAEKWPQFQDFVLAILHGAEWLMMNNQKQIMDYIKNSAKYPQENLTPNQIILASALTGWNLEYNKCSKWVNEFSQRSFLSRQAMRIVIQQLNPTEVAFPGVDPIIFYSTKEGTRFRYEAPFLNISKLIQKTTMNIEYPSSDFQKLTNNQLFMKVGDCFSLKICF